MTLQDKLDAYKKDFIKKVPEDALKLMQQFTEDLRDSGVLARTVKAGDIAPDFKLKNQNGQTTALSDYLDKGSVVLGFYRGRW